MHLPSLLELLGNALSSTSIANSLSNTTPSFSVFSPSVFDTRTKLASPPQSPHPRASSQGQQQKFAGNIKEMNNAASERVKTTIDCTQTLLLRRCHALRMQRNDGQVSIHPSSVLFVAKKFPRCDS